MMKKVIYGAFGLYILAASQPSFSQTVTNSGRLGGSKVFAAKSLPKGGAALGLEEEYFQSNQIPFDGENHFHATQFFFTYAPFSYTQFFINRKIELTMSQDHDEILSSYVLLPSEIGTLFHYPLHQSFSIGLEPSVTFFNGNKIKAFHGTSPGIRGLTTYTTLFGKERSPIHFNANVQYFMNHSRNLIHKYDFSRLSHPSLYGLSQYYSLNYGLGIEAELPYFTSFIEYSLDHMLRSHIPLFKNPNRLSTGLKIKLSRNSAWMLHLGGDFGFAYKRFTYVTPTPHVKGFAGLHYTFGSQTPRATVESTPLHLQPDTQQQSTPKEKPSISDFSLYPIVKIEAESIQETPPKAMIRIAPRKTKPQRKLTPKQNQSTSSPKEESTPMEKSDQTSTIPSKPVPPPQKKLEDEPVFIPDASGDALLNKLKNKNTNEEATDKEFIEHFRN